jgi:hypothetical protein
MILLYDVNAATAGTYDGIYWVLLSKSNDLSVLLALVERGLPRNDSHH